MTSNVLELQRLPEIESILEVPGIVQTDQPSCTMCSHTCCD